jgi:flagellar motor switch protein FliG
MSSLDNYSIAGARKAAILLSLLGDEPAAAIMRNLPDRDLQRVTDEVAKLGQVPFDVTLGVLEEYQQMMAAQDFIAVGGHDVATRLLVKAFGENGAKSMVERLTHKKEAPGELDSLKRADPEQLAKFLVGERPQTKALVLGHLDSKQASALLMNMEPDDRADCVRRLANLGQTSPEVAAKISAVLGRRLKSFGDRSKQGDSGSRNVAEMMNKMDSTTAREILDRIEAEEPTLAITIRDMMFRFDDFMGVPERELRELMNTIDKKTLMVALKGASEELRSHFFRTMSTRAVEMMQEDSEMMGPVRGKEVSRAQSEIVAIARKLESEGKLVLKAEGEDEYVL